MFRHILLILKESNKNIRCKTNIVFINLRTERKLYNLQFRWCESSGDIFVVFILSVHLIIIGRPDFFRPSILLKRLSNCIINFPRFQFIGQIHDVFNYFTKSKISFWNNSYALLIKEVFSFEWLFSNIFFKNQL